MSLAFVMPCCKEPPRQVAWAAARVLHHHPGSRVVVVADGDAADTALVSRLPGVTVCRLAGGPYKRWQYGGTWLHKVLGKARQFGGDFEYLVKLDPDTLVTQPVADHPAAPYSGLIVPRQNVPDGKALTHAAVMFRRDLVDYLVNGHELLDPAFRVPGIAVSTGSPLMSEEIVMAKAAEKLQLPLTSWPVVVHCCLILPKPPKPDVMFAHAVLPFEAPRTKSIVPPPWFQDLMQSERDWFASAHPTLLA